MTVFENLVEAYHPLNDEQRTFAQRETMQKIALAGLTRAGFFNHAAFYGGTCLRLLHGLTRYSEDMDFSLTEKNPNIHLENYFPAIIEEFKLVGLDVELTKKEKKIFGRVESAFLKEDTEAYDITFQTRKMMKVKIELDTDPPLSFETEQKLLTEPYPFYVTSMSLPCLFAGKIHALVYRAWQRRVKGRDWYDFEWYVRKNIPLSFTHLRERIHEFTGEWLDQAAFMQQLNDKLANTSIDMVKKDVMPFLYGRSPRELDFWSNEYFLELSSRIQWQA